MMNRLQEVVYEIVEGFYCEVNPLPFSDLMTEVVNECGPLVTEDFVKEILNHPESDYRLVNNEVLHVDDIVEEVPEEPNQSSDAIEMVTFTGEGLTIEITFS